MADEIVTLRVPVERCAECREQMLPAEWFRVLHLGSGLPDGVPGQLRSLGVKEYSGYYSGRKLCRECATSGRGRFVCALCGETRPSSEKERGFGADYGAEFLCTPCYTTIPAKIWEEKVEALEEAHKYDWE